MFTKLTVCFIKSVDPQFKFCHETKIFLDYFRVLSGLGIIQKEILFTFLVHSDYANRSKRTPETGHKSQI